MLFLGFWILLGALAVQRLVEMWGARRNTEALLANGGKLVPDDGYGFLVVTHSTFFVVAALEGAFAPWPTYGWWSACGLLVFIAGEVLRAWAMSSLGPRWSTRIVVLPAAPLVAGGPYRFVRHPIYVGVMMMFVGFPLLFGLWGTLCVGVAMNSIALFRRIRREDRALAQAVSA